MKNASTKRPAEMGGLILAFVAVILGLAVSGTIVSSADNSRAIAAVDNNYDYPNHSGIAAPGTSGSTLGHTMVGAPGIFALLPLMWAVLLLGIMAAVVIRQF
jgi:hypothetical protein